MDEERASFYKSKAWQATRNAVMKRDKFVCQWCLKKGLVVPAEEVHHIKHLTNSNMYDPNINLNQDNLVALCRSCHMGHHKEARAEAIRRALKRRQHIRIVDERGIYFDETGDIKQRKVYIVYGPPRAGKSTFVEEHMQPFDIVIDVDAIIAAITADGARHSKQPALYLALDIRDYLFKQLEQEATSKNFNCKNVWIVGGFPKKKEREELASRLKAELILIECSIEEATSRAELSNLYDDDLQYAKDIVREWFNLYQK